MQRFGQVDNMQTIAHLKNEALHLGVPPVLLVAEMSARFYELFDSHFCFQALSLWVDDGISLES